MPFIRMPSKALIDALGWEAIQEIDAYFDDAAEELRAERRRLEAARLDAARPVSGEADVLSRLADVEYQLRLEIGQARTRLQRKLDELTQEVARLRREITPSEHNEER
jgi:phosphoglycolate phosphatase-like HAD superfamily hydrolase